MRRNRLERDLFSHDEEVQRLMDGVEDGFRTVGQVLEPALIDLGVQFDIEDL